MKIRRRRRLMEDRRIIYDIYCRSLYWHMSEIEERLKAKAEEDKKEMARKIDQLKDIINHEAIASDARTERLVMAVKDVTRERRYSRRVLRSVEELDGAANTKESGMGQELSKENYKKEEARILQNLRQDDANIRAIRDMSKGIKLRRKVRPEAPRPLRVPIVAKDEETEVVELE